jgi:hypothetical protein
MRHVVASAFLLWSAAFVNANDALTMSVSPVQSFAPTNLTIRIRVTSDADNRALELVADSGEYFRSSRVQLDGADAPRTVSVEMRNLPGGTYDVRGILINSAGQTRAVVRKQVIVLPSAGGE